LKEWDNNKGQIFEAIQKMMRKKALLQKIFKEVLETEIWQKKRADLDQTSC
jgi:hypothetical protein